MIKSLTKNAVLNTIKQVFQIIFPFITIPYVTRILTPENYGMVTFSSSCVSYFSLIAALGISTYGVREGAVIRDNRKSLSKLASELLTLNLISTIISYLLLVVSVLLFPKLQGYSSLIFLQSITIFCITIGMDWINTVEEDYLYLTLRYIIFQVISLLLMFLLVRDKDDYFKYACIYTFASGGANILNWLYVRKYVDIKLRFNVDWKKHITPVLVLFGNALAITIYVNSDITMLGLFQSDRAVGIYGLTSKIYIIIKQVLNAVVVVTIPRLVFYLGSQRMEEFRQLSGRIFSAMLTLVVPSVIGLCFFSTEIVTIVGGEQYAEGSIALIILSLAVLFSLIASFYTNCILIPYKFEKNVLYGTMFAAVLNVSLNIFLIPIWSYVGAAVTTLIAELFMAFYSYQLIKKKKIMFCYYKVHIPVMGGGICVIAICFMLKRYIDNKFLALAVSVLVSSFVYSIAQIKLKNEIILWKRG